jgi:putative Ca2+/H+ antiporter (TMEM165/GDT1 family)
VRELALYLAAAAVYVALGVVVPEVLFAWVAGAAFLLLAVWIVPALVRRLR